MEIKKDPVQTKKAKFDSANVFRDMRAHAIFMPMIFAVILLELFDKTNFTAPLFNLTKCPKITKKFFLTIFLFCIAYAFYQWVVLVHLDISHYSAWNFMGMPEQKILWFSRWSWSHFFTYLIYSFICPEQWLFVGIVGVGYEVLEYLIGSFCDSTAYWTSDAQSLICIDDVIANLSGYILGHIVSWVLKQRK